MMLTKNVFIKKPFFYKRYNFIVSRFMSHVLIKLLLIHTVEVSHVNLDMEETILALNCLIYLEMTIFENKLLYICFNQSFL